MNVTIESPGIVLPKNESHILLNRFHNAFERFAGRIDRLDVILKDVNSPRGGRREVLCMIRIDLAKSGEIVVREKSSETHRAVKKGIRRARALIAYDLKRREWRNRFPFVLNNLEATG